MLCRSACWPQALHDRHSTHHLLSCRDFRSSAGLLHTPCTVFHNVVVLPVVLNVQIAKRQAVVNPENTFFSVKRFVGRRMSEVTEECKQVPYVVSAWFPALLTAAARLWVHACICMLVVAGQTSSRRSPHPAGPACTQQPVLIHHSVVTCRVFSLGGPLRLHQKGPGVSCHASCLSQKACESTTPCCTAPAGSLPFI